MAEPIFLHVAHGPDQLTHFEPPATIILLASDTLESYLPDNESKLIKVGNQTALIAFNLATNKREVSESYSD